jgi:hypothetical protein
MEHTVRIFCFLVIITILANSEGYVVDGVNGDDANSGGNVDEAFKTINRCAQELTNAGDECQIRAGYYHEVVIVDGLKGTTESPIKIVGYQDERPVWDGTVLIKPNEWMFDSNTGICSAEIQQNITALFYKNDLLTPARWPNSLWSDRSIFDHHFWRPCPHSQRGTIVDDALAQAGLNFTGAMAILNLGSWETWVRTVLYHEPGNNNFTYHDNFGNIKFKNQQYYLESSLELLDAPEEWFYEMDTKTLRLILPNNTEEPQSCPDTSTDNLRGRVLDTVLEIRNSEHVIVANITFWASNAVSNSEDHDITFDSLIFNFPSSSHRMLKSEEFPKHTKFSGSNNAVINCTFYGAEGPALQYDGSNMIVHNTEFSFNDWAGQGNLGTVMDHASDGTFSQNTLSYNGVAHGLRYTGRGSHITMNHMERQCWGVIQSDGASIQISTGAQNGIHISYNWIHDSPKKGIRFDGNGDPMGVYGYVGFNVVWNIQGNSEIFTKGDNHTITNNVAWDDNDAKGCTLCVPSSNSGNPMNTKTVVVNNGASHMAGGGGLIENNYESQEVKQQMVDTGNHDFRPVKGGGFTEGSQIRGAYNLGESSLTYWIPGRKLYRTSYPIPQDGVTVSFERRYVISQTGYLADQHHFYFGETFEEVDMAKKEDDTFKMTLYGDDNIFELPQLEAERVYYWRTDAQKGSYVYKGDVWSFFTI